MSPSNIPGLPEFPGAPPSSEPSVSDVRIGRAGIRPAATFSGASMAIAGALGTFGLIVLILGDSTRRSAVVATAALVALVGYVIVYLKARVVMPAGLVAIITGVVVFCVALIVDSDSGVGEVNTSLLLSMAVLLGLYAADSRLAGQTPLLGIAALLFWVVILNAVGNGESTGIGSDILGQASELANDAAWASLIIGVAYLIATAVLDKRGKHAAGTAFAAVGNLAYVVGTFGVVGVLSGGNALKAIVIIAAGCWLGYVGNNGQRRFTTWIAGFIVLVGVVALVVEIENENFRVVGLLLLISGLIIGLLAGAVRDDPNGLSGLISKAQAPREPEPPIATPLTSETESVVQPPAAPTSDEAFRPPTPD
jgi:hypothetical protein